MWDVHSVGWRDVAWGIDISFVDLSKTLEGGSVPLPFGGILLGDFPLEQTCDETLRHAFDQVKVIDGQ